MELLHGSAEVVRRPELGKGRPHNDYGQGFYCTRSFDLAAEWACGEATGGYVNRYEIDKIGLSILHLAAPTYTVLNWLALLLKHRTIRASTPTMRRGIDYLTRYFAPSIEGADLIVGYRADDSYFSFARAFVNNEISLAQLGHAMALGNLGEQYVLKSQRTFDALRFVACERVDAQRYYAARLTRDRAARDAYSAELERADRGGIFIRAIIDEEMSPDDPRLQ